MGFLRGAAIFIVSLILFFSLFFANVFLNLSWSLEYDTLEPNLIKVTNKFVNKTGIGEEINTALGAMELYCMIHSNYVFMQEDIGIEIPCSVVDSGADNSIDYVIEYLIYKVYYDDYNCEFWTCVKESKIPFVLISEKAKDYWHDTYKLMIYIALVALALSLILVRKKSNAFINAGILIIVASVLFKQFDWVLNLFPDNSLFELLDIFFVKSLNIMVFMCVIGALFLVVGILFRFFRLSRKISNLFKKKGEKEKIPDDDKMRETVRQELSNLLGKGNKSSKKSKKNKKSKKKEDYKDLTK